jgi:hypothetical protein
MILHSAPEPDPEPRIRFVTPADPRFSAVAAIAAEVLLAGHVQIAGPIVDAVRAAVSTVIGTGSARTRLEIELSRSAETLTLRVFHPAGKGGPIRDTLRALADGLGSSSDRLELSWDLSHK